MLFIDERPTAPAAVAARRAPQDWRQEAACVGVPPGDLFPELGSRQRLGAEFCREVCPVVAECLEYALEAEERYGVWGGTTEAQRRKMILERRTAPQQREAGA